MGQGCSCHAPLATLQCPFAMPTKAPAALCHALEWPNPDPDPEPDPDTNPDVWTCTVRGSLNSIMQSDCCQNPRHTPDLGFAAHLGLTSNSDNSEKARNT